MMALPLLDAMVPLRASAAATDKPRRSVFVDYNRPHMKEDYTLTYEEWRALCGKPKDEKARLSNVMLTMLQKVDVNAVNFVGSLGPVSEVV